MSSGKMKGYNVLNDRQNFLDKPVKNIRTYNNIPKIATGQEDDETTNCSLFYRYFNENYKMIGLDLSTQGALDCWSESNTANNFHCKFRSSRKHNNAFHY